MLRLFASTFVAIFVLLLAGQLMFSVARERRSAVVAERPQVAELTSRRDGASHADEIVIERDGSGQFHIDARVNGQDATFIVDTGADAVALTVGEADRLGLGVQPEAFQPIARTASGFGNAAFVNVDRVELGGEEFSDVEAAVVEGLHENLLGQSVLRRLGNVELRGDRMIIHPR
jgi:aspartyl protease family protein